MRPSDKKKFQFQTGSIRSYSKGMQFLGGFSFNSKLVRLEDTNHPDVKSGKTKFQFQTGSIRSVIFKTWIKMTL